MRQAIVFFISYLQESVRKCTISAIALFFIKWKVKSRRRHEMTNTLYAKCFVATFCLYLRLLSTWSAYEIFLKGKSFPNILVSFSQSNYTKLLPWKIHGQNDMPHSRYVHVCYMQKGTLDSNLFWDTVKPSIKRNYMKQSINNKNIKGRMVSISRWNILSLLKK